MSLDDLLPDPGNPRSINDAAAARLYGSIEEYGLLELPVWNKRTGQLVSGHQRIEVMRRQGYTHTYAIIVDFDTARQHGANFAMNAPFGQFDEERLSARLRDLKGKSFDLDLTALPPFTIESALQGEAYSRLERGSMSAPASLSSAGAPQASPPSASSGAGAATVPESMQRRERIIAIIDRHIDDEGMAEEIADEILEIL